MKTSTDRVNGHHLTKPTEETILFDADNNEVLFDEYVRDDSFKTMRHSLILNAN